jgi:superfamily II DNA or RNA helicase
MRLRKYVIDSTEERIRQAAKFRAPQRDAFASVHKIICGLERDLPLTSDAELKESLAAQHFDISVWPPQFIFSLATGVGKTRLLGALMCYLYMSNQTRNCLVLAPRAAVLDKLEREAQLHHAKYLFIDSGLVQEPNLCFRSNIEIFRPRDDRLNVFVLSPQSIAGKDRRFARENEFRGFSLQEYLSGLRDLVVFVDEAHHLPADGDASWTSAVRALKPRLFFGLTATPRNRPGAITLHNYDLETCLREGIYTKAVDLIVETRNPRVADEDWDKYVIEFGLRRLALKRRAVQEQRVISSDFPAIEPVLLVCAKDTCHADALGEWLQTSHGLKREEVLITHSEKANTEDDIQRLVSIDGPSNKIRVVINVFRLTEGWDVTNVYVIVTLRAMATFQAAIQTMGRGLRLPLGRRVGNQELDTLDVLCCGAETFQEIVQQATQQFGTDQGGGSSLGVTPGKNAEPEFPPPMKNIQIAVTKSVRIDIPRVRKKHAEPILDFDVGSLRTLTAGSATAIDLATLERTGLDQGIQYGYDDFVSIVSARIIADLNYLSDPYHGDDVERLVKRFLAALGSERDSLIGADPMRIAMVIVDEIETRYREQSISFEVLEGTETLEPREVSWRVPDSFSTALDCVPLEEWK